jgi:hypothetical protein
VTGSEARTDASRDDCAVCVRFWGRSRLGAGASDLSSDLDVRRRFADVPVGIVGEGAGWTIAGDVLGLGNLRIPDGVLRGGFTSIVSGKLPRSKSLLTCRGTGFRLTCAWLVCRSRN